MTANYNPLKIHDLCADKDDEEAELSGQEGGRYIQFWQQFLHTEEKPQNVLTRAMMRKD